MPKVGLEKKVNAGMMSCLVVRQDTENFTINWEEIMSEVTKKDLNEATQKVQETAIAEKNKLNEIKLENDVSYYRKNTPFQWITGIICILVCFINVWIAIALWIFLWLFFDRKVRVSPVGDDSINFYVSREEWSKYRKDHNLPLWKQYSKNHVAEKDIDEVNKDKINDLNKIRQAKQQAKELEKEKEDALYQQAVQPYKENNAQKFGRYYFDPQSETIFKDRSLLNKDFKTYHFSDIVSYTPIEQGHSKTKKHGITRAVVGGVLAGGAGAVVGALTGGKNYDYIDELGVTISFKDKETVELLMISSQTDKSFAGGYYDDFHKVCGVLDTAINKNNKQFQHSLTQEKLSSADEIAKFKKLLDDGTITQEEFDAKKKQLLGL